MIVSDGFHQLSKILTINIVPVDDEIPQLHTDLQSIIHVSEGGQVVIKPANLAAHDNDTDDKLLSFVIVRAPTSGVIQKNGRMIRRFTQGDIHRGEVIYIHTEGEIGYDARHDTVTFVLTDQEVPNEGELPLYDLKIIIDPIDNNRPAIDVGGPVVVNEAGKSRITTEIINAADLDTAPENLKFILTQVPAWGFIENTKPSPGSEKSNEGIAATTWTMKDINDGTINYVQANHSAREPLRDKFELYVTDGKLNSDTQIVLVNIIPTNDEAPQVLLRDFTINEGTEKIIDPLMLEVSDMDIPAENLMVSVAEQPEHGQLKLMLPSENEGRMVEVAMHDVPISDIQNDMQLMYTHDGSEHFDDKFSLTISDGKHKVKRTSNVKIMPVNDEMPQVIKNAGLHLNFGDTALISSLLLSTFDGDNSDAEVHFFVTTSPKRGMLQYKDKRNTSGSALPEEVLWEELKVGQNFTQEDVNNDRIRYVHTGDLGKLSTDKFRFQLSDGVNVSPKETFEIEIETSKKSDIALMNKGLNVKEGERKAITTENLSAVDESNRPDDIVFSVVEHPAQGDLELISQPGVLVNNFTQMDLAAQKLVYSHTTKADIPEDVFQFVVTNSVGAMKPGVFLIRIEAMDRILPSLVHTMPLTVSQGEREVLKQSNLLMTDPDTSSKNLTYIISSHPNHGHILKSGNKIKDRFTQHDIDSGLVTYENDGSEASIDHFLFTLSDSIHKGYLINGTLYDQPRMFSILIQPIRDEAPRIITNHKPEMFDHLGRGHYGFVLGPRYLRATDSDTDPRNLMFVMTRKPEYGYLENVAMKKIIKKKFSQREVDEGNIMYILKDNQQVVNDSFEFNVQDARRNTLTNQRSVVRSFCLSLFFWPY